MRLFFFLCISCLMACQTSETQSSQAKSLESLGNSQSTSGQNDLPKIIIFGGNLTTPKQEIEFRFQDLLPNTLAANGFEREIVDWGREGLMLGQGDQTVIAILDSILVEKPEWVILAFGTEEIWQEKIAIESFAIELGSIVQALHNADIKTMLLTSNTPSPEASKLIWSRGEEISQRIRAIAIEHFSTVVDYWNFCEIYVTQAGNRAEDLLLDERYPNEASHQFLAQEITALMAFKIGTN